MKAVVEPEARIELDSAGSLQRSDLRYELNEYDLYAVEEAIRANEAYDAEVTVVSLGTEDVVQSLRKGLAMGATNALHIKTDDDLADPAASATVLAEALRSRQPDLVLAGVESDDLGGSQVGVLLAERLGYNCATMTIGLEIPGPDVTEIKVRRELEGGNYLDIEIALPAVLTIQTGINEPRYPTLKGIMASKRKELVTMTPAELGFDAAPTARVDTVELSYPPPREMAKMLEGGPDEMVAELLRLLREEEKVL
jgi:electron transfer flavoprotein beta subunit